MGQKISKIMLLSEQYRESLLVYPHFNEPFEINTDSSKVWVVVATNQENKWIKFDDRKLDPTKKVKVVSDREILSIVIHIECS